MYKELIETFDAPSVVQTPRCCCPLPRKPHIVGHLLMCLEVDDGTQAVESLPQGIATAIGVLAFPPSPVPCAAADASPPWGRPFKTSDLNNPREKNTCNRE